jgi:hypothetical protein
MEQIVTNSTNIPPRFSINDLSGGVITLQERGLVAGCFAAVVD